MIVQYPILQQIFWLVNCFFAIGGFFYVFLRLFQIMGIFRTDIPCFKMKKHLDACYDC